MDYGHANLAFAATLLRAAVHHGLRHVVICPGSRSTPLTLAAAAHPSLTTWVLIDERSAAYVALGMARQLQEPVALICTSGTAAANFAPAVIEAYLSRVPLLVLTADRPAELRDWGAAQTIDQTRIYGSHTRWFADLPAPVGDAMERHFARAAAARATRIAAGTPAGPVHLNVQFREPLIPPDSDPMELLREDCAHDASDTTAMTGPGAGPAPAPPAADIDHLVNLVRRFSRGLLVCGPHNGSRLSDAAAAFSAASGYPVLADPLSSVRFDWPLATGLVDAYDIILRDASIVEQLAPEVVIRVGGMPTSKPLTQFLARHDALVVAVDPGALRDAGHAATSHIVSDEAATLLAATSALRADAGGKDEAWQSRWKALNCAARQAIARQLSLRTTLVEPALAAELVALMPPGSTLVVGNSMPVRDIDTFAAGGNFGIQVMGTRGASGIDGVVSTAIGAATVAAAPVALLVGDLSFLHDLGGLQGAGLAGVPLVIVVVNNDGGGIFSFLPQHNQLDAAVFERLFGTPAAVDVAGAAQLFGCGYLRPESLEHFRAGVRRGLCTPGVTIIEARTDRDENLALHREIAASVLASLRQPILA